MSTKTFAQPQLAGVKSFCWNIIDCSLAVPLLMSYIWETAGMKAVLQRICCDYVLRKGSQLTLHCSAVTESTKKGFGQHTVLVGSRVRGQMWDHWGQDGTRLTHHLFTCLSSHQLKLLLILSFKINIHSTWLICWTVYVMRLPWTVTTQAKQAGIWILPV